MVVSSGIPANEFISVLYVNDEVPDEGIIFVQNWLDIGGSVTIVVVSGISVDEPDGTGLDDDFDGIFSSVVVANDNIDVFVSNEADVDGSAVVLATGDVTSMVSDGSIRVLVSSEVDDAGDATVVGFNVVVSIDASDESITSVICDLADVEDSRFKHVVFPAR